MKKGLPSPTVPLFQVSSSRFFLFHSLNDFQSCEFFPFFFFQCICDTVDQIGVHRNGDILQSVCPFLRLFDVRSKAIRRIFHHGKFYRQIFYFSECICSQVYALAGCTESVGRRRHGRGVFYVGNLGSHNIVLDIPFSATRCFHQVYWRKDDPVYLYLATAPSQLWDSCCFSLRG